MSEDGELIDRGLAHEKCGSSDGVAVYRKPDGKIDAYCWACATYINHDPRGGSQPERKQHVSTNKLTVNDVYQYPSADLQDRMLRKSTLDYFGVKVGYDESDGVTIAKHYYPVTDAGALIGYKERVCATKDFLGVGTTKKGDLFGQYQANFVQDKRKLFITEGEIDAMTIYQVLVDQSQGKNWEGKVPAVVSITKGAAGADKELARHLEWLSQWDSIHICFDNDDAGKEGLEKVTKVLPIDKIKVCRLPLKDANDMLRAGKSKELEQAVVWNALPYKPLMVKSVMDIIERALEQPVMGDSWIFPTLNYHTYGRKWGNLYGVAGGVGIGKSSLWYAQMAHDMKHGLGKHGAFFFEEDAADSLNLAASFIYNVNLLDPGIEIPRDKRYEMLAKLEEHVYFCDHSELVLGSKNSWDEIMVSVRHMAIVEGCRHITIDPITALTAQMSSGDANDFLNAAFAQLAGLAKQLNINIYYGAHLNKPERGKPHEEGGRVQLSQLTGSKAMIKWSQFVLGIERNNQDPVYGNTSWIRLLKIRRRYRKENCLFPAYYDTDKVTFEEVAPGEMYGDKPPCEMETRTNPRGGLSSDNPNDERF